MYNFLQNYLNPLIIGLHKRSNVRICNVKLNELKYIALSQYIVVISV